MATKSSKDKNKGGKGSGPAPTDRPVVRTRNDLPEKTRAKMIELCNARLADSFDLLTQIKQAHWNVRGPHFWQFHKLFDEIHEAVEDYIDMTAERAGQLGGYVEGTARMAAQRTTLDEYPLSITDGMDHVRAVADVLAQYGAQVREAIETADDAEDAGTADMFTEISRGTDQWLWFVEAHLQGGA